MVRRKQMNVDNKLDLIEWQGKLNQFSIIQLRLAKDMIEEVRNKYDMELFKVGQEATMRRIQMDDYIQERLRLLEVEIDFQEKQQEENQRSSI